MNPPYQSTIVFALLLWIINPLSTIVPCLYFHYSIKIWWQSLVQIWLNKYLKQVREKKWGDETFWLLKFFNWNKNLFFSFSFREHIKTCSYCCCFYCIKENLWNTQIFIERLQKYFIQRKQTSRLISQKYKLHNVRHISQKKTEGKINIQTYINTHTHTHTHI